MLTELAEADARGEIAEIFAEIRHLYATPYVSSIHRHMATRPGVLEWAWEAAAPAFRSGLAQQTAWRIAETAALRPLPPIPAEALAIWGIAAADIPKVAAIAESFTRVAPLNLVFGGIVRELLRGKEPAARAAPLPSAWAPPPPLAAPPPMVVASKLSDAERHLLALFRSGTGDTAFVPGLYRMLAHWPGLLAHLAVVLSPSFASEEKKAVAAALVDRIDEAVSELRAKLPRPTRRAPSAAEATHLLGMIDGYRVTSPEMILFGRLIREALPR
jgi:hypothetical protein